ncbi:MAG: hypothetical protein J07HQX50_01425 [Haloquadratum sp. J07HQX50]|nr:MAG: hypothetical protein J07HQX50_01425 [Haloquadratum sp. J07HQX50]
MQPTIEYCHANADAELRSLLESVHTDITCRSCLEHCGICRREPFIVIDGEVVSIKESTLQDEYPGIE